MKAQKQHWVFLHEAQTMAHKIVPYAIGCDIDEHLTNALRSGNVRVRGKEDIYKNMFVSLQNMMREREGETNIDCYLNRITFSPQERYLFSDERLRLARRNVGLLNRTEKEFYDAQIVWRDLEQYFSENIETLFERKPETRGRKKGDGAYNDEKAFKRMKCLLATKKSRSAAARIAFKDGLAKGSGTEESTIQRLSRNYPKWEASHEGKKTDFKSKKIKLSKMT